MNLRNTGYLQSFTIISPQTRTRKSGLNTNIFKITKISEQEKFNVAAKNINYLYSMTILKWLA